VTAANGDEGMPLAPPVQSAIDRLAAVVRQAHKERRWGEIRLAVRDGLPYLLQTEFSERLGGRSRRDED